MPELPDVTVYIERLRERVQGRTLESIAIASPFLLRTAEPALSSIFGQRVRELRRLGKRIAFGFENHHWLVLHLMIAGRLHWFGAGERVSGRKALARFIFDNGVLTLTEAGTQRRASLHLVADERGLAAHERGGLEPLEISPADFAARLRSENHTLKRSLTDPTLFSGIGNAYSDEILHAARLSPIALSGKLTDEEIARLYEATQGVLRDWLERLRRESASAFPEGVTAFRPEFAVHGRFGQPCPICGTKVQRIRYATNETNYCPRCQTGGRVLADRSLSRLLKDDWPRSIEELEAR
ncbi:MAG TPA: DNA-formamidopyrimidine glycosylase family protein [Steroidobacteraceae bacterium]|nr:DNA-formamidopyrimidine glycosylase family protein [Steroidobacteraceae bacterium]